MKPLSKYMIAAGLGAAAALDLPQAFHAAARHYRDASPARDLRLTVQEFYPARPGLAPEVVTTLGLRFVIEDNPARGVTNAQAVAAQMRRGCSYDATAYGLRSRDVIRPNLIRARLFPTPECPKL